jgi:hypothetical protein
MNGAGTSITTVQKDSLFGITLTALDGATRGVTTNTNPTSATVALIGGPAGAQLNGSSSSVVATISWVNGKAKITGLRITGVPGFKFPIGVNPTPIQLQITVGSVTKTISLKLNVLLGHSG